MSVDWVALRDKLNLTLKPIDEWPGKPTAEWTREKGPFTASLKDTLATLRKELNALSASAIVLQIAIKPHMLRLDGLPRAGATAEHPGVILTFDSTKGKLRIWFDRFTLWENNLRAIAMHLEHLRMATLYGVGEDGQAYSGWTALPPGPTERTSTDTLSVSEAVSILLEAAKWPVNGQNHEWARTNPAEAKRLILAAQAATHADNGGSDEAFRKIQPAIKTLKARHGL